MTSGLNNSNILNNSFLYSPSMANALGANISDFTFRNDMFNNRQMSFYDISLEEDINRVSHEENNNRESHEENIIKEDKHEEKSEDKIKIKEKNEQENIKNEEDINNALINIFKACIKCIEDG